MTATIEREAIEQDFSEPGVYTIGHPTLADWVEGNVDWHVTPQVTGPVWDKNPYWEGPRDPEGYILPYFTLGYQALKWARENLLGEELDEDGKRLPFKPTPEQVRMVLWFYAIDERGKFIQRQVTWQRLKGWGKDPMASVIAAIEFVGPCRFLGWANVDMEDRGLLRGDPVAGPHPRAWIQTAAVSLKQTKNTMLLFLSLFSDDCKREHSIDIGKEVIYAYAGQKQIEAVTSSPRALEGNRPTLVIGNEPHQWVTNNSGLEMRKAIVRNLTKAKGGGARVLWITNAYNPNEDSAGRLVRESWEKEQASGVNTGVAYDSLEAPRDARMRPRFPDEEKDYDGPEIPREIKHMLVRRYIGRVLEAVRGGSWWLEIESLTNFILSPENKMSESRRFFYNQIVASEESWVDPAAVTAAIHSMAKENRQRGASSELAVLEAGWIVHPEEQIVLFFDGSKSDDSTALVGCRLSDGYCFLIGVWQKPDGERGKGWLVPRAAVNERVKMAFERFNIVAFWGDPSHTKDEEIEVSYWMPYFDTWMNTYKDRLDKMYWPVKSGINTHAINFDMSLVQNLKAFIKSAEQTVEDFQALNDVEEYAPTFQIDGHPVLINHLNNAVGYADQRGFGTSLAKEHRESARKIDAAVCLVGARLLRRAVLNATPDEEEEDAGEIW